MGRAKRERGYHEQLVSKVTKLVAGSALARIEREARTDFLEVIQSEDLSVLRTLCGRGRPRSQRPVALRIRNFGLTHLTKNLSSFLKALIMTPKQ